MGKPSAQTTPGVLISSTTRDDAISHGTSRPAQDADSLARQIAVLDGVTYAQALQQIQEMMCVDVDSDGSAPMTLYNLRQVAPPPEPASSGEGVSDSSNRVSIDGAAEVVRKLRAAGRIDAITTTLELLCEATGMRFAAVARVSDERWIACASAEQIRVKGEQDAQAIAWMASHTEQARTALQVEVTDTPHPLHTMQLRGTEGYMSVPIIMPGGHYFGNLCAIDPSPSKAAQPHSMSMFKRFAQLIGQQLEADLSRHKQTSVLFDERAAGELREQFIAVLGHDLRNPLHSILAGGTLLERKLTDPALRDFAARIRVSARRMSSLIDDVLDFARSRLGSGIGLHLVDTDDIDASLTAVVKELRDAHPDREIVSNTSVGRTVCCDIGRIQQIASNLIGNALTHGAAESPIRVSAYSESEEFVLTVWNAGEPIVAESMGKIFQPFWRQSASVNRQGLGLGLHISSQIVEAHGGILFVTSTKEVGTQFTARLPLRPLSS